MGGALSSPAVLVRSTKFMIILKKETHYCHVDSREKAQKLVNDGYEVIKNRLKDVDSAKFRNIYFNRGKLNLPATCGQVNSKNSFGSYTGYKRFIFAGKNFVFIESDVSDFHNLWNKLCE